jgi:hypothetical protein
MNFSCAVVICITLGFRMSYFIRIWCRSPRPITRMEISDFILEGEYFDEPQFTPSTNSPDARAESWESLVLQYEPGEKPVSFTRNAGNTLPREELEQLRFLLEHSKISKPQQEVSQRLKELAQIISIEVNPDLPDDVWEMLNGVEAFVARKLDGIIYDPDTGFYDKNLKLFYRL